MPDSILIPDTIPASETLDSKKGRFKGYAADRRLRDGTIEHVERSGNHLAVTIETLSGGQATIRFYGVVSVIARHPERLPFTSLVEWNCEGPERHFEFSNWIQPGDDWDPHLALARLEVQARGYDIDEREMTRV